MDVVRRQLGENTRAVHLPQVPVPEQQPLGTPVYRTAAFAFRTSEEYASVLNDERPGYSYSRIDNPTVDAFARAVAALEGPNLPTWPAAQAFASGMAAISTVFLTFARTGAHIVASAATYGGTYSFLRNVAGRFGVETDFVDMTSLDAGRAAPWIGAMPWEDPEQYVRHSPIYFARNWKTPTLLLAGDRDPQADEFYLALQQRKVDSVMVRVPDSGKPSGRVLEMESTLAWLESRVK